MTDLPDDDELRRLRERAYGPRPDIHGDPEATKRLLALEENAVARQRRAIQPASPEPQAASQEPSDPPQADAPAAAPPPVSPFGQRAWQTLSTRRGALMVMWAVTLVVALIVAGATVTVVQRVQVAPLIPDAEQVARLGVDASTEIPGVFGGRESDPPPVAFKDYLGLEVVLQAYATTAGDRCLVVYDTDSITFTDGGYSNSGEGGSWSGCGAGAVPPMVAVAVTPRVRPERLRENPGVGVTLQFVYDAATDEVVVFQIPASEN